MASDIQRRSLQFASVDDIQNEVATLNQSQVRTTGHYRYAQILEHLARAFDVATGHLPPPKIALPVRLAMRMMRPLVLSRPMKPGLKLPSEAQSVFWPDASITDPEARDHFAEALTRYRMLEVFPKHPLFGNMTRPQMDQLQCRHCELHLSFVHPVA